MTTTIKVDNTNYTIEEFQKLKEQINSTGSKKLVEVGNNEYRTLGKLHG